VCAKSPATFKLDPVQRRLRTLYLVRIEYRHNVCFETASNYASAFIRSDIRRMRNNSRYLEYCEPRRTCLRQQNNMRANALYILFLFSPLLIIFLLYLRQSSPVCILCWT